MQRSESSLRLINMSWRPDCSKSVWHLLHNYDRWSKVGSVAFRPEYLLRYSVVTFRNILPIHQATFNGPTINTMNLSVRYMCAVHISITGHTQQVYTLRCTHVAVVLLNGVRPDRERRFLFQFLVGKVPTKCW